MEDSSRHSARLTALLLLVIAVGTAFWPVLHNGFVSYDDEKYVTRNRHVQMGLGAESLRWALTTFEAANWHPLTWASHMLDWQLWGERPLGHHLSSLLLHLSNTLLLFLLLERMTRAVWRSALVAALFGVHPLHVESVAWVAERKDVLSTLFWLLTIGAYLRYARDPSVRRYAVLSISLTLGLCSKPMLVTVPFTLLLLDYWPLGRWSADTQGRTALRLIREKLPLFLLSAAASVVTLVAQRSARALGTLDSYSLSDRLANAAVSYSAYLWKAIWPVSLAVHYPHPPEALPAWKPLLAALLLVAITVSVFRVRRRCPYLLIGWLWYLGTLVPVIGLVQVGQQAMADRYSYVPLIGPFIMLAWGVPDLLAGVGRSDGAPPRPRRVALALVSGAVVVMLIVATWFQLRHWRDSVTLFERALAVTESNAVAHNGLGLALATAGRPEEAIAHYRAALEIQPRHAEAHNNLAGALAVSGRVDEAIGHYERALSIDRRYPEALNNLGVALAQQGRVAEALERFRAALAIRPDYGKAHANLAAALYTAGDDEAAWREIDLARRFGFEPPADLVRSLSRRSPRPD
jgi:tetratricopeptide (TPR) repeat protein